MNFISYPNNSFYLSCKSKARDDCEYLSHNYVKKENITGKIYNICKDENCSYILKVIIYDGSEYISFEHIKELWLNEVSCLQKINKCQNEQGLQFVPEIQDYWMCKTDDKTYFYIVMEKFDGNLYDFIEKYKSVDEIKIAALAELKVLEHSLSNIHKHCDICLNDIKLENILYKQLDKYLFIFVFTDTGNSSLESSDVCKKQDLERFRRKIQNFKDSIL